MRFQSFENIARTFDTSRVVRILIALGLTVIIALLYPRGLHKNFEYPEGSVWNEADLIAPFPFPIYRDPTVVEREQREAARTTAWSFDRIDTCARAARNGIHRLLTRLASAIDSAAPEIARTRAENRAPFIEKNIRSLGHPFDTFTTGEIVALSNERLRELHGGNLHQPFAIFEKELFLIIDAVYQRGYIDREKSTFEYPFIAVGTSQSEEIRPLGDFLDASELASFISARMQQASAADGNRIRTATLLLRTVLKPDIVFNEERTRIAVQAAVESVPRTQGIVKMNERIVSRHERITPAIKAKLDSYQRTRNERAGNIDSIPQFLGRIGHTAAILMFLGIYLALFRKRIFRSNKFLLLIAIVILMETLLTALSFSIPVSGPVQYLILVPTGAMLIAILFDSRIAFYATVTIAFLVGALRGNDYSIILASTLAGSLALYTVRDIKHRTQIFRSLAFIFLGYSVSIVFDGLQRSVPVSEMGTALFYALANAILSPVLTFGLLIFFERLFGIDTDLTLLELSDLNQPLLRELSNTSPGTFHHSITMGTLAESAAAAIGANPILARVGAYYHDIGKIRQPEFFVENQKGAENIHQTLAPIESAHRIIAHVGDGIELAMKAGLPRRVIDFIPEHHGTTSVVYFLEKEQREHPANVDENSFRYAGPRPRTKETAIVMLADTIEASARTLEEPTPETLAKLIDDTVAARLAEGQLEECDLTFRELRVIKDTFLNVLIGIHHNRIKYPSDEAKEAARKQAERTAKLLKLPPTTEAIVRRLKQIEDSETVP
ncbi:MAG: HDIG domain-containing protein [Bacteroidota bacterium]|nr:HDIG domain-containing protein [Bacteroidota bacterium]